MGKNNIIFIVLDSLRQDHVSFYNKGKPAFPGIEPCKTPNIDKLAEKSLVFTNVYPNGLPTIPVRTEWMTGQYTLPYKPWEPLYPYPKEITIADILAKEGYKNALITDTYHFFKPDMNFHRSFHSFIWIRGQEYDAYASNKPLKKKVEDYVNEKYTEVWKRRVEQFLANTEDFTKEEDYFPAQVFTTAVKWLQKNIHEDKPFLLWIDCFDPHEPWDPPPRFDTYTDSAYHGPRLILPMGGYASEWASNEEIKYIRGLYAGEVSFVDYWVGYFLDAVEDLNLLDNTIIVLTADHGHPLADHGKFLKGTDRLYNELVKVPFIIRTPECEHRIIDSLIQFPDVLPTLFDLLGLSNNTKSMHGKSFSDIVKGEEREHRKAVIIGYHEGIDRCIRDKEWSLILRPEGEIDELYNLKKDPKEKNNVIDEYKEEAKRLASYFGKYFFRERKALIKGVQEKYEISFTSV
ncbi:MAG: sulfatase [Thermofilum sp. ex4484_82]|nr:MAG: sulfatase [Thermofilum sp. ex4484_82]OYT39633.1 MAG: sulfatase [Archaeoglobales archaeon ex4484_92]